MEAYRLEQTSHSGGGLVKMGEAVHVWGQRVYEKSLHLLLNFSVNLKLLLKKLKKLH